MKLYIGNKVFTLLGEGGGPAFRATNVRFYISSIFSGDTYASFTIVDLHKNGLIDSWVHED